ncbi:MAG: hypothetical protein AAF708_17715 [Deinococcota bacterium]
MSKKKKRLKAQRKASAQARKLTSGKLIRLALKSLVFAVLVSSLIGVLLVLGVDIIHQRWAQLSLMAVCYIVAFPLVFSEFRPKS